MNKFSGYTRVISKKINKIIVNNKNIDKDVNEGIEEQKDRFLNPLKNIIDKSSKFSILYIIINIISIILAAQLLMFSNFSIIVWGIILIYTGISDLLVSIRTMNISKKLKEEV